MLFLLIHKNSTMSIMDTLTSLVEVKLDIGIDDIDNDLRVSSTITSFIKCKKINYF